MVKNTVKSDRSTLEVNQSDTKNENNSPNKVPSCTLVLKQFLSRLSDGHVYNSSIILNPKIKVYIDNTHIHDTNLFIDMQGQVNDLPTDLIFNEQVDFVIPSFRSVITFELYDHPRVSNAYYTFKKFDISESDIFISAIKFNISNFTPGKLYNLILYFTGNLNPTIYEYGDILTNINPNELSCSHCKVCALFNYTTMKKTTSYYTYKISSDYIVESLNKKIDPSTDNEENKCTCVPYSKVTQTDSCSACLSPCCGHRYDNYVSMTIKINGDDLGKLSLLKSPELIGPVVPKSNLTVIDSLLHIIREGKSLYSNVNNALNKTLRINVYTFIQAILCTLFLFPFNIFSLILIYIGILFIVFSIPLPSKDETENFKSYCIRCFDDKIQLNKIKFTDLYKSSTCIKCLHLQKCSEVNILKSVLSAGASSLKSFIDSNIKPYLEIPIKAIHLFNVFIILSKVYGKELGISCFLLSFILIKMRIIRLTLYYILFGTIALFYTGFNVNFIDSMFISIKSIFYYMIFISNQREFNNRIYWS